MKIDGRLKFDNQASTKVQECGNSIISGLEAIIRIVDKKGKNSPSGTLVYRKSFTQDDLAYTINISKRRERKGYIYRMDLERYKRYKNGDLPRMDKSYTSIEFRKDRNVISDFDCKSNDDIESSMTSVGDAYFREFRRGSFSERHPWAYGGVEVGLGSALFGPFIYRMYPIVTGVTEVPSLPIHISLGVSLATAVVGAIVIKYGIDGFLEEHRTRIRHRGT